MAPIDGTLETIGSQEAPNYSEYARQFNVPRSTPSKRHRGVQGSNDDTREKNSLLSRIQKLELVKYINMLPARGLPPTNTMVNNFARDISGEKPGKNCVLAFESIVKSPGIRLPSRA